MKKITKSEFLKIVTEMINASNTEIETLKKKDIVENFNEKVDFQEDVSQNTYFIKQGDRVYITYQGEIKAHTQNELLATIPEGYRPKDMMQCWSSFASNSGAFGIASLHAASGELRVAQISNTSYSGRIVFQMTYNI